MKDDINDSVVTPLVKKSLTAADLVNRLSESSLERLFQEYGEVSSQEANRVSRLIGQARMLQPISTTNELVKIILGNKIGQHFKKSPATKFFQSLRIAVNNELEELDALLNSVPNLLCSGGAFVVISFHSLEDRRVKIKFKELTKKVKSTTSFKKKKKFVLITKKPIVATKNEIKTNRRSRSSRLRVLNKI